MYLEEVGGCSAQAGVSKAEDTSMLSTKTQTFYLTSPILRTQSRKRQKRLYFQIGLQGLRQPIVRCSRSQSLPVSLSLRLQQVNIRIQTRVGREFWRISDFKILHDSLSSSFILLLFSFILLLFSHICNENRKDQMNYIQKGDCYDISENYIHHSSACGLSS